MLQPAHPSTRFPHHLPLHSSHLLPDQLLTAALREAGIEPAVVDDVIGRMDQAQFDAATSLLLAVLDSEKHHATPVDPATGEPRGPGEAPGAYRLADTFREHLFPIAGLVATFIATEGPGSADLPRAAGAMTAFWNKLATLTPTQDNDALAVARAVGTLATRATHAYSELAPSSADIASETGLSGPELVAALRRLCDVAVLANVEWAGREGDFADPGNRWRLAA
jgi:hypothetical protein